MSALAITGCGVLSAAGVGLAPLAAALTAGRPVHAGAGDPSPAGPGPAAHTVPGFDVRQHLGRKGTAFLDRSTALAVVACSGALADSALELDDGSRHRVGVAMGTTLGSLRSMSDYTRETLVEERPYLVNPALFPNTVMNCAAGQSAIRHGLRGVNATVAGGPAAFLSVLRYAADVLRRGHADAILAGAVEEHTPHRAWAARAAEPDTGAGVGEGAVVFVVERLDAARAAGRHVDAEVLAVAAGYCPGGGRSGLEAALRACGRRALDEARLRPGEVSLVVAGPDGTRAGEPLAARAMTPLGVTGLLPIPVERVLGRCHAAAAALEVAMLVALHRGDPRRAGRVSMVTAWTPEGGVATALLRGFSRAGADRR